MDLKSFKDRIVVDKKIYTKINKKVIKYKDNIYYEAGSHLRSNGKIYYRDGFIKCLRDEFPEQIKCNVEDITFLN